MFVRYFVEVSRPSDAVEDALLSSPRSWMPGVAGEAEERSRTLLAEVGFEALGHRVDKRVEVEVDWPQRFPSKTVLPMVWRPTGLHGLFPTLEADLEIAPLGPNRTQVALNARYRPPLGTLGQTVDRAMLHRVAEATVKDFLDRVGQILAPAPSLVSSPLR